MDHRAFCLVCHFIGRLRRSLTDLFDTGLSPLHKASLRCMEEMSILHQSGRIGSHTSGQPGSGISAIGWFMVGDICTKAYVSER